MVSRDGKSRAKIQARARREHTHGVEGVIWGRLSVRGRRRGFVEMYLKNAWYVGATSEEVAGRPLGRTILGEPVVFYRDEATKAVAALEDRCCHRGAPLSSGFLAPKGLGCGYHGIVFDESGAAIEIPGQENIPARARVRAYRSRNVRVSAGSWMGDPARADEQAIPRIPDHTSADDERPRFAHGVVHVKASCR